MEVLTKWKTEMSFTPRIILVDLNFKTGKFTIIKIYLPTDASFVYDNQASINVPVSKSLNTTLIKD